MISIPARRHSMNNAVFILDGADHESELL